MRGLDYWIKRTREQLERERKEWEVLQEIRGKINSRLWELEEEIRTLEEELSAMERMKEGAE